MLPSSVNWNSYTVVTNCTTRSYTKTNWDKLIGGKPFYYNEWLKAGTLSIKDLLDDSGRFLSFQDSAKNTLACHSSFLQFYRVISAIPNSSRHETGTKLLWGTLHAWVWWLGSILCQRCSINRVFSFSINKTFFVIFFLSFPRKGSFEAQILENCL